MLKCKICLKDLTDAVDLLGYEEVREVHRQAHYNESLIDAFTLLEEMVDDYNAIDHSKDAHINPLNALAGSATRWVSIARNILRNQHHLLDMYEEE